MSKKRKIELVSPVRRIEQQSEEIILSWTGQNILFARKILKNSYYVVLMPKIKNKLIFIIYIMK